MKKIVRTEMAPAAIGPYNQGVVAQGGKILFTAGQIPLEPATGEMCNNTIQEATEQALNNVKAILEAAGSRMDNVLKMTVFMADISEFAAMNEVYARFFPNNPPARSAFQVAALPKGAKIEIEAIALVE